MNETPQQDRTLHLLKDFLLAPKPYDWVTYLDVAVMAHLIAGAQLDTITSTYRYSESKVKICMAVALSGKNTIPVHNSLLRLKNHGWIEIHSRRGAVANTYEIHFDKIPLASIPDSYINRVEEPQKNLFPGKEDDGKAHT